MEAMRRELTMFASDMIGAQAYLGQCGKGGTAPARLSRAERRRFQVLVEESPLPCLIIDPRPGLHIVEVNGAFAAATMTRRDGILGQKLFHTFPDNPDRPEAEGVSNLYDSMKAVAQSGRPRTMPVLRYDLQDAQGVFVERHWRPRIAPIFDDGGRLLYLLNHVVAAD
jgi:PAS domain-containing protein